MILLGASLMSKETLGGEFRIKNLEKGQEVTLTVPALTRIPHGERFYVAATDLPQTVSFRNVLKAGAKNTPLKISIYDSTEKKVKYVTLKQGVAHLYPLKSTERVLVITQKLSGSGQLNALKNQYLQVSSGKPLTYAR